ncbi:MAG: hypothetical protein M1836_006852 [Candelina mexicana]|nr:MAG: hypothetical protein M1836_006852 [Candelina mexicana]
MAPRAGKGEYIETDTGNKVSRKAHISGTQHIILAGRTVIQADVTLRGDLVRPSVPGEKSATSHPVSLAIGRYTILKPRSVLRPPGRLHRGVWTYHPQKIGDHCSIGEDSVVEAAYIGNHCVIGKGAVIGKHVIIKDYVKVLPDCVVPPGMVVPSQTVIGGRPGRIVGEVGDGWGAAGGEGGELREAYRKIG